MGSSLSSTIVQEIIIKISLLIPRDLQKDQKGKFFSPNNNVNQNKELTNFTEQEDNHFLITLVHSRPSNLEFPVNDLENLIHCPPDIHNWSS